MCWITAVCVLLYLAIRRADPQLEALPTVGFTSPFLSYLSAFRFLVDARSMIEEGCARYPCRPFRIANFSRWIVAVSGDALVEELRRASDDVLSFTRAAEEIAQISLVLGESVGKNPYHIPVLQTQLTRNLHDLIPVMRDEMEAAFGDQVPRLDNGWQTIHAPSTFTNIICRISNRVFVGLPLCRDPAYIKSCTGFVHKAFKTMLLLSMTPLCLRPFVVRVASGLPAAVRRMQRLLDPLLEDRLTQIEGVDSEFENDLVMWLVAANNGGEQDKSHDTALRLLTANFAAIHTTSMTFVHALYNLAVHPSCAEMLRKEVRDVVAEGGWSKASIDKMYLVDSFLRETMRMQALRDVGVMRKSLKPFTFWSAVGGPSTIPAGVLVYAAAPAMHFDPAAYGDNAHTFDPLRFVPGRIIHHGHTGNVLPRNMLVGTSPNFFGWGGGKHLCPGRFFAAVEMKMMLAYLATSFDVTTMGQEKATGGKVFPVEGLPATRPRDFRLDGNCFPNPWAKLRLRRREAVAPRQEGKRSKDGDS
ncbi:cytochrome P450 [Schizophyllum fasciatum]